MKKAVIILLILLIASLSLNVYLWTSKEHDGELLRKEVYVDTIPYCVPVQVDSVIVRYETHRLPISIPDTLVTEESVVGQLAETVSKTDDADSAEVVIPITQKVYEDSLYRAYVSGFRPSLDSIFINHKTEVVYIRSPTKPKRWGIGIHVGAGYTPHGLEPYIGIGVSYSLLTF